MSWCDHNHQAASWEFFDSGNTVAARVLLQRALRLNSTVANLWTQYFRLEWCYVQKIIGRREILGLHDSNDNTVTDENNSDTTLDIPKVMSEVLHICNEHCLMITMLPNGGSLQHVIMDVSWNSAFSCDCKLAVNSQWQPDPPSLQTVFIIMYYASFSGCRRS
jgi:hypothetical protein